MVRRHLGAELLTSACLGSGELLLTYSGTSSGQVRFREAPTKLFNTAGGTWTVYVNQVVTIKVTGVAGGGHGGLGSVGAGGGGGGAGAHDLVGEFVRMLPGISYEVKAGAAGGASSFRITGDVYYLSLNPGGAGHDGIGGGDGAGGAGGTVSVGAHGVAGGDGGAGGVASAGSLGGGDSDIGAGGGGGAGSFGSTGFNGGDGGGPGGVTGFAPLPPGGEGGGRGGDGGGVYGHGNGGGGSTDSMGLDFSPPTGTEGAGYVQLVLVAVP